MIGARVMAKSTIIKADETPAIDRGGGVKTTLPINSITLFNEKGNVTFLEPR